MRGNAGSQNGLCVRVAELWLSEVAAGVILRSVSYIGIMIARMKGQKKAGAARNVKQNNSEQQTWTKFGQRWRGMPKTTARGTPPQVRGVTDCGKPSMPKTRICYAMRENMGQCLWQAPVQGATPGPMRTQGCRDRQEFPLYSLVHDRRLGRTRIVSGTRLPGHDNSAPRDRRRKLTPWRPSEG